MNNHNPAASPFAVAVTSKSFSEHPILRQELMDVFPQATFNLTGRSLSEAELIEFLQGKQMAIVALDKINSRILDQLPELKVISKYGVGLDNLDLAALKKNNIKLGWTGGVNRRSVAELTLFLAIGTIRKIFATNRDIQNSIWRPSKGLNLTHKKFGILGLGHIGQEMVKLLSPFQCEILAHDLETKEEFCTRHGVKMTTKEEVLRNSDIVSIHLPLDESTRHYIDQVQLQLMKEGAILINCARGGIVNEEALLTALNANHLWAAGDVLEVEPPNSLGWQLLHHHRFFGTSHIGGSTEESILAMGRAAIQGLMDAQV